MKVPGSPHLLDVKHFLPAAAAAAAKQALLQNVCLLLVFHLLVETQLNRSNKTCKHIICTAVLVQRVACGIFKPQVIQTTDVRFIPRCLLGFQL